ncbi:MAG: pirin family protein [Nitrososphaerota archaeon]|nr:pirin family protein [Candidatus Bathyarchaeota archaeon]MDW8194072.1 pirin family protein [Nitrososphaerota archaeon]
MLVIETVEGDDALVKRVFQQAITFMLEGGFHHVDNIGNDTVVLAGGMQKFTADKGIIHFELPGTNGLNRELQLWIRLPSKLSNIEPDYQQTDSKDIPENGFRRDPHSRDC